jgi:DNA-binding transcriptional MerR regulator
MSRLLTLPQLAEIVGVEYRTLHTWLRRGLLRPSGQRSEQTGVPNLFYIEDAVHAKIIADLRSHGVAFELLKEAADLLAEHPDALRGGSSLLVNGSVSVVSPSDAQAIIQREKLTLVYNTEHAVREVEAALPDSR